MRLDLVVELRLQLLHCAVEDGKVVAAHGDHLVARGEVLQDEQMGQQVLNPRSHQDVTEDGQHLVCIQHPLLLPQSITLIKAFNFAGDAFGTAHDDLHFADG
jgi:hypothetical protein